MNAVTPQPLLCRRFCMAPCRGGRSCPPDISGFTGTAVRTAMPQPCLRRPTFSVAPEKVGKKMRRGRIILRADARDFLAALRPERPDGRRIATIPIVFSADEFTTRSYRQTASISVLLIFGILGQPCSCTAPCRGRCPHRPVGNQRIRRRFP